MKPVLAVSMGDPAGIGPEIVAAASRDPRVERACSIVLFGDASVVQAAACGGGRRSQGGRARMDIEAVTEGLAARGRPRPGRRAGEAAFRYLDAAARAVAAGRYDALVTAPINKYWMSRAGHDYDGHTGYLSELSSCSATMMLAGRRLRVVLVTTHLALSAVPGKITGERIRTAAHTTVQHLREYHSLARPRLAVAALNPHAGENGLFGTEEKRIIAPAIRGLRRARMRVEGPFPADTLFAAGATDDYDAVLCMYHDQALIPLKLLEFGRAVNVTMGLPFVRTSPDHGTAYELAGTGKARADSMIEALLAAASMVRNRRRKKS